MARMPIVPGKAYVIPMIQWKDMNVNVVAVLLDHIARKLMLVQLVHVRIMVFVSTCRKDMKEMHINAFALMVS